ncbi:methyltransferase domain-containing protein [Aliifodinibius salicampi]|uniref:Methyltransferase domain-containing protein n=1 Tax=Fodinibius salicampi TaxID=1920655 RepID=A0ABT3Q1D5_9BACT|nr:methyltransferase domain-containing protein [Fodinibius salicampi]MCW9713908.1 methyltransferase domain-containing protein [Fodinibius salicampi]
MEKGSNQVQKSSKHSKTLGPVESLEQYLTSDWWKRIFNSMYLKTDADVVEDPRITEKEVTTFHEILNIEDGNTILDLACGQGRHLIELATRGSYNLFGLDRSRYLIQRARRISKEKGLSIAFKEGDIRKLPYPADSFDYVTNLGNSFGYFETLDDDIKILEEIFRVLKPGGKVLLDIADGSYIRENFTPRSWEWIDDKHFVCRERSLAQDNERLITREIITHSEKGVIVDQFYAERLYTKEQLSDLIERANFQKVSFHGNTKPESLRDQDLGMMEQRFILTANAVKERTSQKNQKKVRNVVVVMGDPSLRDAVKPDAVFDSDDFDTIEKLVEALNKLDNYKFNYLNNHKTLVSDLQQIQDKADIVLNLCDEGFENDATKELHIPSLLEMLNIPYTGSNPQTLAYCYDKSLIRGIATEVDVPVADAFVITENEKLFELNVPFPVIAKPNFGDSSFGITKNNVAHSVEELADAIYRIRKQFGYAKPILIEEFLTGAELSVGVVGNTEKYTVLPIIEEDYSNLPDHLPKICGYEAKWLPDSPYMNALKSIPASIPPHTEQALIHHSLKLFKRLDCRDYCRFDWRLNSKGEPKLLEVNPNPGWCWDGHLAKMCSLAEMDYSQMLGAILDAAAMRLNPRNYPKINVD